MKYYEKKGRFSLGEIDPPLCFRVDTDIPNRGLAYLENGLITSSAGITNFPALKKVATILAVTTKTIINAFKIFKYKIQKKDTSLSGYLFLFTELKVIILREDNFEVIKEIEVNYTDEEIENLSIAQFQNSVITCVANKKPEMIRVMEDTQEFDVVEYWENIVNPPVKRVETQYQYTDEEKQVFQWYQSGASVVFESTISSPIFKPTFLDKLKEGTISYMAGEFRINKIEGRDGKQKITTTQVTAPAAGIDIPTSSTPEAERKINILDITFSESLFNGGYPAVVAEYKGRVIFGNVAGNPSAIVSSRVYDSTNFRQSTDDNDGFTTFVTGNEVNTVKEFIAYKSLIVITDRGIYSTQLNEGLTTETSALYDQKLPRPKGLGYWTEADDAIYYVDSSNRIYQIQDVGADSAYVVQEVTLYSGHLMDNINDIYFHKIGKNNIIGVDTVSGGRVLSYNYSENILCWTRVPKLPGINEYLNIDDKLYIFNVNNENIDIYTYSSTEVEPLKLKLPKTTMSQNYQIPIPEFLMKARFKNCKILCYGNYNLKINNQTKSVGFGENTDNFYEKIHYIDMANIGKEELVIEQLNNEKIEIVGIFAEIG